MRTLGQVMTGEAGKIMFMMGVGAALILQQLAVEGPGTILVAGSSPIGGASHIRGRPPISQE